MTAGSSCIGHEDDEGAVAIGALVPFTGTSAAGGASYERAMVMAIEHLNREGGVLGEHFRLVTRDSHSTVERTSKSLQQVMEHDVVGLVGPEDVALIQAVRDELKEASIPHLLPSSVSYAHFADSSSGGMVFLSPSAEIISCALANRIYSEQYSRLVVIYSPSPYRQAFAQAVVEAFETFRTSTNIGVGLALPLPPDTTSYVATIQQALAFEPDVVVIATEASVGANLVNTWQSLRTVQWYFDPALRSEEFLRNVSATTVDGSVGISQSLPDDAETFAEMFSARWDGEPPEVGSYLHYDAVITLGLATIRAATALGRLPEAEEVAEHVLPILRPPGRTASWTELGDAIAAIRAGEELQYVGAAGRLGVREDGHVEPSVAVTRFWAVRDGQIVSELFGACPAGTLSF